MLRNVKGHCSSNLNTTLESTHTKSRAPASTLISFALFSNVSADVYRRLSCEEFSKDSNFSSSQALGKWYLVQERPSSGEQLKWVLFSAVSNQERQELKARIGKHVTDLKWSNLVLKMQIPCTGVCGTADKTRDYFLEKLETDGSFNALLMPSNSAKVSSNYYNQRHNMRLKLVERKYLALMDCAEQFTFVLDREPHDDVLDLELMKTLQLYLPQGNDK